MAIHQTSVQIHTKELVFLLVILLFSFLIRWHNINSQPYGIEGDEFAWTASSMLVKYDKIPSDFSVWQPISHLTTVFPITIKLNQLSFYLFGDDFLSPRKMISLLSTVGLLYFYLFLRSFVSWKSACIGVLLYSLSSYKLISSLIPLQGMYSELFFYPALLFLSFLEPRNRTISILFIIMSSICMTLSFLTYNVGFLLPFFALCTVLYVIHMKKIKRKDTIVFFSILLLLSLLSLIVSWKTIYSELTNRSFMLGNSVISYTPTILIHPKQLIANGENVIHQLFFQLENHTSDMLLTHSSTIIPKPLGLLFLIGLLFAFFSPVYSLLIIIFITQMAIYHILLGLYQPRIWIITVGLLYMLMAVYIEKLLFITRKVGGLFQPIAILMFFLFSLVAVHQDSVVYQQILKNQSYKHDIREIVELVRGKKKEIGDKFVFVADENSDIVYITSAFYYLSYHGNISINDKLSLGIVNTSQIIDKFDLIPANYSIIGFENTNLSLINNLLARKKCSFTQKSLEYYSEVTITSCMMNEYQIHFSNT